MKENPLISVIVPVYNTEKFLAEALDSVINQTYTNLEIIIVDDGSTDTSGEIAERYANQDKRIKVIHRPNSGLSVTRNTALDIMTGDLCAFLDSDDAYDVTMLEKLLHGMIDNDADMAIAKYVSQLTYGKLSLNGKRGQPQILGNRVFDHDTALRALADSRLNHQVWNKLYRSELWQKVHFNEGRTEGKTYEDIETSLSILNLCKTVFFLDEPLYMYRKRQGSITWTFFGENYKDKRLALSHCAEFILSHDDIFLPKHRVKWGRYLRKTEEDSNGN